MASSTLPSIAKQVIDCTRCELREGATAPVPGLGDENATYFLLGESPGAEEDRRGAPFIGASGKRLDKLLALAKIDIDDCYLTNMVKCHPPKNRNPKKKEMALCRPWLLQEIRAIKPEFIITLGSVPLSMFTAEGVKTLHGTLFEAEIPDEEDKKID